MRHDETVPPLRTHRRRPRLKDIADATGVSIKTVSRALHGEDVVRPDTRDRIVAEADRLGFRPNDIAAGLRSKNQAMSTLGVTLGDITNSFFAPMLRGIHAEAAEHRYLVMSADAQNDPGLEKQVIQRFFTHRVAGLIIAPIGRDLGFLETEASFGVPIVFVDSPPPGLDGVMDSVTVTNAQTTRQGVEMLIARGHRRIGYLGHSRAGSGALERWRGFEEAHRAAGLSIDPGLVHSGLTTEEDASGAADELLSLDDAPTAVFTDNNRLCIGLLSSRAFRDTPVDLLSFDDFPLADKFGVSAINSRPFDVGRTGAGLLFRRLADPDRPPEHAVIDARLIIRERG